MNDDFLTQAREQPRRELAERLYQRISQNKRTRSASMFAQGMPTIKRVGLAVMVVCFVLGGVFVTSPAARAQVGDLIKSIAGFTYKETNNFPQMKLPSSTSGSELRDRQHYTPPNVEQLLFPTPTWMPTNFTLGSVHSDGTFTTLIWRDRSGKEVILGTALKKYWTPPIVPVGAGSTKEVQINGQLAALVRGTWNSTTKQWDMTSDAIRLQWTQEDRFYSLAAMQGGISEADLIHMAESVR